MDSSRIRPGMRVISRDGVGLGTVANVDEHGFAVSHDTGGGRYRVGIADVTRVDEHVHLDRDAAFFTARKATAAGRGAASGTPRWLVPLLVGLALLALL